MDKDNELIWVRHDKTLGFVGYNNTREVHRSGRINLLGEFDESMDLIFRQLQVISLWINGGRTHK